jgi:hypothetical protein
MGTGYVALFAHHEFQLSGQSVLRRQASLHVVCVEFAARLALWEMSKKLGPYHEENTSSLGTHEDARLLFPLYLPIARDGE